MITSDDIRPKEWMSWVIANDMVRMFGRREGGECFPAEYQLTRLIVSFREVAAGVRRHRCLELGQTRGSTTRFWARSTTNHLRLKASV